MKANKLFILLTCLISFHAVAISQVPIPVKDNSKRNQLKSMEFMQWKFSPEWYYYSWWTKKVFGVPIRLPGLGLHRNYVKTDKRNQKQELPTIFVTNYTKERAKKQREETDKIYKQQLAKFADRNVDIQYKLTSKTRNLIISDIKRNISRYVKEGGNLENASRLIFELDRIQSNIKIINKSHLHNAERRKAYLAYEEELSELLAATTQLLNLNRIYHE